MRGLPYVPRPSRCETTISVPIGRHRAPGETILVVATRSSRCRRPRPPPRARTRWKCSRPPNEAAESRRRNEEAVAASIVGTERRRRRAEHLGPRVQRAGTEPRVGERHHVRAHARGLALPRRRHRPLLASGRRLVDPVEHAHRYRALGSYDARSVSAYQDRGCCSIPIAARSTRATTTSGRYAPMASSAASAAAAIAGTTPSSRASSEH